MSDMLSINPAWDVFISHASEDKAAVAEPLAILLERAGLRVWLDTRELQLGDPLRQKLDDGLTRSRFGVVVLSPTYLSKRWTRNELDGLFAVEDASRLRLLPVWHGLDESAVRQVSPLLAARLAGRTSDGLEYVARAIVSAVLQTPDSPATSMPGLTRLLLRRLEEDQSTDTVRDFLRLHPDILAAAVGASASQHRVLFNPGGPAALIDAAVGTYQGTSRRYDWTLVALAAAGSPVVRPDGSRDAAVENAVNALARYRDWAHGHLAEARRIVPGIAADSLGVVFAGRRAALSPDAVEVLQQWNDELSGIRIRTLDSFVDACAEMDRSRRSLP